MARAAAGAVTAAEEAVDRGTAGASGAAVRTRVAAGATATIPGPRGAGDVGFGTDTAPAAGAAALEVSDFPTTPLC